MLSYLELDVIAAFFAFLNKLLSVHTRNTFSQIPVVQAWHTKWRTESLWIWKHFWVERGQMINC